MLTKKLACPSCGAGLRVPGTVLAGKRIKCPSCEEIFAVPAETRPAPAAAAVAGRPRKAPPPPQVDDDDDEEEEEAEERPVRRKRRFKAKKAPRNTALIVGLVLGGVAILIGGAVTLAVVFWPSKKGSDTVADNTPSRQSPAAPQQQGAPSRPGPQPGAPGQGQGSPAPGRGQGPGAPAPANPGGSDGLAAGRAVFTANNCARCHAIGGVGGPPAGGRARGPDLGAVGRDPTHTVDWLAEYIREPSSHKPNSRMPAYEGKIQPQDLRNLAEYLASLK